MPVENLVGEENKGWTYAKYLLTHERTNIAGVGFRQAGLDALKRIAGAEMRRGRPLIENPLFRRPHGAGRDRPDGDGDHQPADHLAAAAGQAPGAESSMLKVKGTIIRQEINDLTRRAVGPYAMPFVSEALDEGYNDDADRAGLCRARGGAVFQQPQTVDLWRIERDPARDHRQDDAGRLSR